ncbi:MAG: hypothetical protein AB1758_35490 [Candidatus Eremiobacterota bacterium]
MRYERRWALALWLVLMAGWIALVLRASQGHTGSDPVLVAVPGVLLWVFSPIFPGRPQ